MGIVVIVYTLTVTLLQEMLDMMSIFMPYVVFGWISQKKKNILHIRKIKDYYTVQPKVFFFYYIIHNTYFLYSHLL